MGVPLHSGDDSMNDRKRLVVEFLAVYLFWEVYSIVYPFLGRWSISWNGLLLELPGTSRDFVLSILLWTKSHPVLYTVMDAVYHFGFSGPMVVAFLYLLLRDPPECKILIKAYALSFLVLSIIFLTAHVNAPHHIYPDLPRKYSPPSWLARPQFVFPSPHCTIATVSFLALFMRREKSARFLSLFPFLVPPSTVLLAEHWIWDTVAGIVLGAGIWFLLTKSVKISGSIRWW
ncbi:phosphatase PAP2 family protein [Thermococcus profundus]|uniref:phosphatase PAP2 family protein n=1 Tax=Thermococcus profundus TaxID=49899 RepID=UPI0012FDA986|nr:phosphatase PAP2 family protein [Thermococcus profundus]